jgi:Spy/CpxP family protein refolding chaperone
MRTLKKITLTVILGTAVVVASGVYGGIRHNGFSGSDGREELDLTLIQKAKLFDIGISIRNARKTLRGEMRDTIDVRKYISADGLDKETFVNTIESKMEKAIGMSANILKKASDVLTQEQRLKFLDNVKLKKPFSKMSHRYRFEGRANRDAKLDIFKKIDLTQKQKEGITELKNRAKKERKLFAEELIKKGIVKKFISANGFDQNIFVETMTKNAKAMIEKQATLLEKAIGILTVEQRMVLSRSYSGTAKIQ